jgi:hypothetical protein
MQEWMTKEEALAALKFTERSLNRRVADGFIRKKPLPRQPGMKAAPVAYMRQDVEAILAGKAAQHAVVMNPPRAVASAAPATMPAAVAVSEAQSEAFRAFAEYLAHLTDQLEQLQPAAPPPAPWLTLAEAAEYSGLPKAWLRRAAEAGSVEVLNVGTEKQKIWRFHRDSLAQPTAENVFVRQYRAQIAS